MKSEGLGDTCALRTLLWKIVGGNSFKICFILLSLGEFGGHLEERLGKALQIINCYAGFRSFQKSRILIWKSDFKINTFHSNKWIISKTCLNNRASNCAQTEIERRGISEGVLLLAPQMSLNQITD